MMTTIHKGPNTGMNVLTTVAETLSCLHCIFVLFVESATIRSSSFFGNAGICSASRLNHEWSFNLLPVNQLTSM